MLCVWNRSFIIINYRLNQARLAVIACEVRCHEPRDWRRPLHVVPGTGQPASLPASQRARGSSENKYEACQTSMKQ